MERWVGKVAVVTGASAGIGAALSLRLANLGLIVVGLARRDQLIKELASKISGKGSLHARQCNLANYEDIKAAFHWIEETFGGCDILVNNAGIFYDGHITDVGDKKLSDEDILTVMDVNFKGLVMCARQAIESMVKRNFNGHIINVNRECYSRRIFAASKHSHTLIRHGVYRYMVEIPQIRTKQFHSFFFNRTALWNDLPEFVFPDRYNIGVFKSLAGHYVPLSPNFNVYSATKHAVTAFTTALFNEMGSFRNKIKVTSVSPGLTDTGMAVTNLTPDIPILKPEDVADAIVYVISTPPHVNISELGIQPVSELRL